MHICNKANQCHVNDCHHMYEHKASHIANCVLANCINEDGVRSARCIKIEEEQMDYKEGTKFEEESCRYQAWEE